LFRGNTSNRVILGSIREGGLVRLYRKPQDLDPYFHLEKDESEDYPSTTKNNEGTLTYI